MKSFSKKLMKLAAVVLTFAVLLTTIPVGTVSAATDVKTSADGKYIYQAFTNGTMNLMGFDETAQILEIPETIDGYTVTHIQPETYVSNPLEGFGYFGQENDRLTHVILPETLIWLGDSVFESCTALESVYIPDSVYYVGGCCFYGCTSLTSVTIPKSCTRLGDRAFEGCTSLSTVVFHDNINYIGPTAFRYCESLTSVTLPDSVIEIADFVFADCTNLSWVNIPENVERIGYKAFAGCTLLTDFEIPESVVDVAASAFLNTGYDIAENWEGDLLYVDNWLVASTSSISGEVTVKEGTVGIAGEVFADRGVTDVKLPDSLKYIAEYAFADVESSVGEFNQNGWYLDNWLLKPDTAYDEDFTVIDGTVGIAGGAFSYRYRLNHLTLPDSLKYIGAYAFYRCEALTKVDMGPVEHIGSGAFEACESLADITLPESLTYLGNMAFGNCVFTEITIPQPITKLHTFTFGNCANLQTITLHHNITNIYFETFYECSSLNQVRYDGTEEQWNAISIEDGNEYFLNAELVYIESSHTHNWDWVTDKNPTCIQSGLMHEECTTPGCYATQNETVIQPSGEHIWEWVIDTEATCKQEGMQHEECECGATQSEDTVIPMLTDHDYENGACKYCKIVNVGDFTLMFGTTSTSSYVEIQGYIGKAEHINLPATIKGSPLTQIQGATFLNCDFIKTISIPVSVTRIGNSAFQNCTGLTAVYYAGTKAQWEEVVIVSGNDDLLATTVYCTDGPINNAYDYIVKDDNTAEITGYNGNDANLEIPSQIGEYTVTSIGNNAFRENDTIDSITLPDTVTSIGDYAFYYSDLKSVNLGNGLEIIGRNAFYGSDYLETIIIGDSLSTIGYNALHICSSLKNITVSENNQSFSAVNNVLFNKDKTKLLRYCTGSYDGGYSIPTTVTQVEENAFYGSKWLEEITITDNVTLLGSHAFSDCTQLSDVHIGANVQEVGLYAFGGLTNVERYTVSQENPYYSSLNGVWFNKDQTKLITYPFGSTATSYTVPDGVTEIGEKAFAGAKNLLSVVLSDSVEFIRSEAFNQCTSLVSITIGEHVKSIENDSFYNCKALTDVYYGGSEEDWANVSIAIRNDKLTDATIHFAKASHTHNWDWVIDKSPTCIQSGLMHEECTTPGCYATQNETVIQPSGEHIWKWVIDTPATCGTAGVKHEECAEEYCSATRSENTVISATGNHKYNAATCTKAKTCSVCKATSGKKLSHKSDAGTITKSATCTATGTKAYRCTLCKITLKIDTIAKVAHKYASERVTKATLTKNGSIVKKCTACGMIAGKTAIKYAKSFKLSATVYTYNGKAKTPTVTIKDSAGKKLKKGTDYTVTYQKGRKNVGSYKVIVKLKGNYSGSKTLTFKINPPKTKVSKLTAGKKKVTVAIAKKTTQVSGYQVQYATSKKFSKAKLKTVSNSKTTKYTVKGLNAKKTYYVRVRTYKTVGKTKYYSGWSTHKSVKTK